MNPQPDRHRPERTCVQCGAKGRKDGFFRIAGRPGKDWEPDPAARKPGRGIYLCRGTGCIGSFARRIRTPKGARRFLMGDAAAALADSLEERRDGD